MSSLKFCIFCFSTTRTPEPELGADAVVLSLNALDILLIEIIEDDKFCLRSTPEVITIIRIIYRTCY